MREAALMIFVCLVHSWVQQTWDTVDAGRRVVCLTQEFSVSLRAAPSTQSDSALQTSSFLPSTRTQCVLCE